MSINNQKIIDLCKKEKGMVLYSYGQMQWIGVGGAAYPLLKVPHLDEDTVKAIYSLPDGMTVQEAEGLPPHLSFANEDRAERPVFMEKIQLNPLFMEKIQLNPSPDRLLTLRTSEGVCFIKEQYLKPLEEGENGTADLYERRSTSGQIYIVAKQGMMLEAVIMPVVNVIKEDWLDDLQNLLGALRQTFEKER